jgi:type IV pilus assembly protein PilC
MFIWVVPRFAELFGNFHGQLPFLTKLIIQLSSFIQHYLKYLYLFVLIILFALIHKPFFIQLKSCLYNWFLKIPYLQRQWQLWIMAIFARSLSIVLACGIPITIALKMLTTLSTHSQYTSTMLKLQSQIAAGLRLHLAMQKYALFPALLIQMVKIGEETGSLSHLLEKTAEIYETEISQSMNQVSIVLEPLIIIILGVLIGVLVIAMYLPIFKLGTVI